MSSRLMNFCQRLLSPQADSLTKRSSRQRRRPNSQVAVEVLESRQMLTAQAWEPVEIADDAAAFFDDSYVHEIYITFEDADWYNTLFTSHDTDPDDPYFEASFVADGVELGTIGVRFKGNSSFEGTGIKKSFKLDFNEFEQDGEDLNFLGLKKLNLNNNYNDPTMLREKLFYDYASNFVEGVGRAVHTKLYVNGEYYGLYTAVEQVDKTFVQSRFGSEEDGNLYKGTASDAAVDDNPQADFGSDLTYLGTDQADYEDFYELKTNETANDYSQLIELIDVLNNTSTAELPSAIEPLLDVEDTLASLAINNLFGNLDSYSGAAHNFYLYDRDDTGQFTHIFWDVNESFGTFTLFTAPGTVVTELDPFWLPVAMGAPGQVEPELRPLAENLWAVDEYSTEYLRDLAEMLREGFDVTSATERINELADLIRADVTADPNKQFNTEAFEFNLTSTGTAGNRTIYGLTTFIEQRAASLQAVLDTFAAPTDLSLNELMTVNVATVQDEAGDFDPWVEIYNNGPGSVTLAGTYLTDDANDLTKWAIPAGDLNDGEFLTLWLDGETGEGTNHTSFAANAAGGELLLTDGISVIDTITYGVLSDDTSLARLPDGAGEFATTTQPTFGAENQSNVVQAVDIYINEIMADNDASIEDPDEAGAFEDWIELYNPGSTTIDLSGFYLTDDSSDPTQWQFPAGSIITAGGYLMIWADGDTDQGDTHASFKLSAGGEVVELYNIDGTTLVDSVTFGEQTTDVSYGRYLDGTGNFFSMATATPGAANVVGVTSVEIYINEIMADNDSTIEDPDEAGAFEDWVELYNPGSTSIDLSGFYLRDDSSEPTQWQFPSGSTIAAGGYLIIWADGDTDQGDTHASFGLSSGGETVELYNIDGATLVDSITFGEQTTDVSYGRLTDGTDILLSMTTPTPGATNVATPQNVEIYINELMADNDSVIEDPDDAGAFEDWIELYNPGATSIDLTGFYLTDDSGDPTQWQFPTGSTIDAGGYLVIWADDDTGQGDTHASFKLSAGGEVVELYNIDGTTLVDSVTFGEQVTDVSYGRSPDGTGDFISKAAPTPGASNVAASQGQVSIANATLVTEGDDLIFVVSIDQAPTSTVSVVVSTSDGTSSAGSDYAAITSQTVTFEPGGSLTQSVTVATIDDSDQDSSALETVFVDLSSPSGVTLANSQAIGYIADNERLSKPIVDAIPRYPDSDSPTMTWQAVTGAVSYNVWLTRRFPAVSRVLVGESAVSTASFTPSADLDPGYYKFWVQAVDSNGVGGTWSDVETFEIRPELGTPTIASFTSPPTFTWTAIPNAPGYELYIRTSDGQNTVIDDITATTYTPSAALSQTDGRWWIRSSDAIGNFGWTVAGTFGTRTEVTSPAGTQSTTTPTFNWVAVQGAGRYILHVTNLDTSTVAIREDDLTAATYTPTVALPSGNYRVWVKAIDATTDLFSSGAWSSSMDFTVAAIPSGEADETKDLFETSLLEPIAVALRTAESEATTDGLHVAQHTEDRRELASQASPRKGAIKLEPDEGNVVAELDGFVEVEMLDHWMGDFSAVAAAMEA